MELYCTSEYDDWGSFPDMFFIGPPGITKTMREMEREFHLSSDPKSADDNGRKVYADDFARLHKGEFMLWLKNHYGLILLATPVSL